MTLATAALLLGFQTIPETASVIYTGIPECATNTSVQMVTHSATYKLSKTNVSFESLTTLRNTSDKPTTIKIYFPVRGKNVNWNMTERYKISAQVNKSPLTLKNEQSSTKAPTETQKADGIWAASYSRSAFATLSFKAKETKSITVNFNALIGRAGLDKAQRMIVYDTAGADNWSGSLGQFNYALQYNTSLVLQVFATLPDIGWQVGNRGAFVKKYNFMPAENSLFIFTYYPGGFEPIGGSTGGG